MRLTCPGCGATLSLEILLNDTAARQAVVSALALPASLGPKLLRYLGLFRPPQRSLTWDRAAKLLTELQAMIATGQIQRHGRAWAAPHEVWASALDTILDRPGLQLPLKSHGYLLEIIAGLTNKTEAQEETAQEEQRRNRPPDAQDGMKSISALLATLPSAPSQGEQRRESVRENFPTSAVAARRALSPPPPEFLNLRNKILGKSALLDPTEKVKCN